MGTSGRARQCKLVCWLWSDRFRASLNRITWDLLLRNEDALYKLVREDQLSLSPRPFPRKKDQHTFTEIEIQVVHKQETRSSLISQENEP